MELPFTTELEDWSWETVDSLSDHGESQYLEFKQTINPPSEAEREQWRRKLEQEITAFANASGGVLVFGVDDEGQPHPFEPPEHEIQQSITSLIQNAKPLPNVEIPDPITPPSEDTSRVVLPIKVVEAVRKPVLTSEAAVYVRINDRKEPMSRDQMEALFVEQDRRQQAVRQLEMEIDRFDDIYNGQEKRFSEKSDQPPNYHLLNLESLKEALRSNTHLYREREYRDAVTDVFHALREVEDHRVYYARSEPGTGLYEGDSVESYNRQQNRSLKQQLDRLERALRDLVETVGLESNI